MKAQRRETVLCRCLTASCLQTHTIFDSVVVDQVQTVQWCVHCLLFSHVMRHLRASLLLCLLSGDAFTGDAFTAFCGRVFSCLTMCVHPVYTAVKCVFFQAASRQTCCRLLSQKQTEGFCHHTHTHTHTHTHSLYLADCCRRVS